MKQPPIPAINFTADSLDISIEQDTLYYKDSADLTVSDIPEEFDLIYSSSDENVAVVDENGNVTATGRGSATITVTVVDKDGNTVTDASGEEVSSSIYVTVKYSFWQWVIRILTFFFGWC